MKEIVNLRNYARMNIKNLKITQLPYTTLQKLNGVCAGDMSYMFYYCTELKNIPNLYIDTENCKCMAYTFGECSKLETIDGIEDMNTKNVKSMNGIFIGTKLKSLDLSKWDVHNVFNLNLAFEDCNSLEYLNIANWNTEKVEGINYMFYNCCSLEDIKLPNWNTSSLKGANCTFSGCGSLKFADLKNWDVTNVKYTSQMFAGCFSLKEVDITNWNTENINYMNEMFIDCEKLEHIEGVIDMKKCIIFRNMFWGCDKLKGVKIKNPPKDFSEVSGLNKNQYEVVE